MTFRYIKPGEVPCTNCICLAICKRQDLVTKLIPKCIKIATFYYETCVDKDGYKSPYNCFVLRDTIKGLIE